jgi:parvulin-like peptidyl-prolyl isomerase
MKRKVQLPVLLAAGLLFGLAAGELLYRYAEFRILAGRISGRGRLVAIASGKGIYETDPGGGNDLSAGDLVVLENLKCAARKETVDAAQIDREIGLIEAQFGGDKLFRNALRSDHLSISALREKVTSQLRGIAWLEKQVRAGSAATEEKTRQYYEANRDSFTQPVRFRAAHLFLAAHTETPPEVVEEKDESIAALSKRLSEGETLSQLVAEASEDEATKSRGGDLDYFAESRTPPEFIAEIKKLRVGETSKPFRSHLGFHIAELTETKDARLLSYEEARPEILVALGNARRGARIHQIAQDLSRSDYSRPNYH